MNNSPVLNLSQMHELKALGLDCSDASMCFMATMYHFDADNLTLWPARYASVKDTPPVGWSVFPAYTLQDLFDKFPYGTKIQKPQRENGKWSIKKGIYYYPKHMHAEAYGNTILEAAFEFVKQCLSRGLIHPKESPEETYVLTKEAKERLTNEITEFLEKGKRIERGEEKADATLSDSFVERLESAYKKQEQKDIEREIESIHLGTKGNGLMDGMLTYKDKEESE